MKDHDSRPEGLPNIRQIAGFRIAYPQQPPASDAKDENKVSLPEIVENQSKNQLQRTEINATYPTAGKNNLIKVPTFANNRPKQSD